MILSRLIRKQSVCSAFDWVVLHAFDGHISGKKQCFCFVYFITKVQSVIPWTSSTEIYSFQLSLSQVCIETMNEWTNNSYCVVCQTRNVSSILAFHGNYNTKCKYFKGTAELYLMLSQSIPTLWTAFKFQNYLLSIFHHEYAISSVSSLPEENDTLTWHDLRLVYWITK